MDFTGRRVLANEKSTWPEADPGQADSQAILIVGPDGGVIHTTQGDYPAPLGSLTAARQMLALGPLRVLLVAADAADLPYDPPEKLRETPHTVVRFTWEQSSGARFDQSL